MIDQDKVYTSAARPLGRLGLKGCFMNCVKCDSQGGFLCKCGTRYCGRACQKAHWKIHKTYCSEWSLSFKVALDSALKFVIECWDESVHACFTHISEADALAGGYNHARATGEVPDLELNQTGVMSFIEFDVVAPLVKARLRHDNRVLCREWLLVLSDDSRKKITSVMLDRPGRQVCPILAAFAPEHAMPGWSVFHFFDYEKAISVMAPLMHAE